jgi:hypothetical protein
MKKAWAVSRKYDHKVSGHTVERTKARAVAEARRLAEFYKSHGREIVSLKNRCGDMFFVKGDEDGQQVAVVFHIAPEGHFGRTYLNVSAASRRRINRLLWDGLALPKNQRPRYRVVATWEEPGIRVTLSRWPEM